MIKLRSFRLRIALLSAILAGSALVGFGVISTWLIYQAKVSRLDGELESQLLRAGRPRSPNLWQSYADSLPRSFGTDSKTPIALIVISADDTVLYRSQQWSADLSITNLWISAPPRSPFTPFDRPPPLPEPNASVPDRSHAEPPPLPVRFVTQHTATGAWRIGAATTPVTQVAIAVNLSAINQEMTVIRNIFWIAIPGILLLVAGGAWGVATSSLQPIHRFTTAIGSVTASGLEQRVPIGATDTEFIELIQVFNQMLERLERSFKQSSRFSADAAHELKTPLAILQGELERALQQAETGSELQQRLSGLLDEVRRLSGIVRKLLLLSLADAGRMNLYRVAVDLSQVLRELLEDIELLAPHLEIETKIAEGLWVLGDRDLLIQLLQNLISNAIKYNLPNGWIRLEAHRQNSVTLITLSNASKDIPASDRTRIFDRFHRGDPARTRKVEGVGLGLSLAQEIARSHGGSLTLHPTPSGQTTFILTLTSIDRKIGIDPP